MSRLVSDSSEFSSTSTDIFNSNISVTSVDKISNSRNSHFQNLSFENFNDEEIMILNSFLENFNDEEITILNYFLVE